MVKTRAELEGAYKKNQQNIAAELKTPIKKTTAKKWVDKKYSNRKKDEDDFIDDESEEVDEGDSDMDTEEIEPEEIDEEKSNLIWDNMALNTENKVLIRLNTELKEENSRLWEFIKELKGTLLKEAQEYLDSKK